MSSVIIQLCALKPIPAELKKYYQLYGNSQLPLDRLTDLFLLILEGPGKKFIVVDALDECPLDTERGGMLALLEKLHETKLEQVHVLVTSRAEVDITELLDVALESQSISIENSHVQQDVSLYISQQIIRDERLKIVISHCQE